MIARSNYPGNYWRCMIPLLNRAYMSCVRIPHPFGGHRVRKKKVGSGFWESRGSVRYMNSAEFFLKEWRNRRNEYLVWNFVFLLEDFDFDCSPFPATLTNSSESLLFWYMLVGCLTDAFVFIVWCWEEPWPFCCYWRFCTHICSLCVSNHRHFDGGRGRFRVFCSCPTTKSLCPRCSDPSCDKMTMDKKCRGKCKIFSFHIPPNFKPGLIWKRLLLVKALHWSFQGAQIFFFAVCFPMIVDFCQNFFRL